MRYKFTAPYLLTQSDCETMTIGELTPELYPNALMEDILHRIPEK